MEIRFTIFIFDLVKSVFFPFVWKLTNWGFVVFFIKYFYPQMIKWAFYKLAYKPFL